MWPLRTPACAGYSFRLNRRLALLTVERRTSRKMGYAGHPARRTDSRQPHVVQCIGASPAGVTPVAASGCPDAHVTMAWIGGPGTGSRSLEGRHAGCAAMASSSEAAIWTTRRVVTRSAVPGQLDSVEMPPPVGRIPKLGGTWRSESWGPRAWRPLNARSGYGRLSA